MILLSTVLFLLISIQGSFQWSGHYYSYLAVSGHKYVEWCDYHCWSHHSHRTETLYATYYRCDPMWTHNGDQNCNIPLCSPSCSSGKCTVKSYNFHACDCPDGRTGASCSGHDCSFKDPCYPGECRPGSSRVICKCQKGFSGHSCLNMPDDWNATISVTHARMSFWKRGTNKLAKEEYGLEIYSTEKTTTKWTNMERFNWLNVSATAMFNKETPLRPSYVLDSGFGIVNATVNIKLLKLPVGGLHGKLTEDHVPCNGSITRISPVNIAECKMSKPDFSWLLENGDRLTLELAVTTGGFRRLIDRKTRADKGLELYTENNVATSVTYRFDFETPYFSGSKTQAFHTNNDFTKLPIHFRWSGWTDILSGMGHYTLEYFRLEPNGDGDLREVNETRPIAHEVVNHTNPIIYPLSITPPQPGMYSFILGAYDVANNSVYMRRCILYDPESSVTTDTKHRLFISSAHRDSSGHQWINQSSTPLVATWTNHFLNYAHEKGKYLNRVLALSILLVPEENIYKRVNKPNDDYDGARTVNAVPNIRGIVQFQTAHAVNKSGGTINTAPQNWNDGTNLTTSQTFDEASATSGSTLTFWVRAIDAMGNKKVDATSVTFDYSEPSIGKLDLQKNKASDVPFSSKLKVPSVDRESGIDHVEVKVIQINDRRLLANKTLAVQSIEPKDCTDTVSDCYCPAALTVCYKRINELYISNCWLMVSKNSLKTANVSLEVGVVNRAGLMTSGSITITDLASLNGTEAYLGPTNVKADKISQSRVRLTWNQAPSCYPRTFIWLSYNDSGKMIKIYKDAESYSLTGLEPGKQYTVQIMTDYGGIKSKPVKAKFSTLASPGIGPGIIAGIAIGILLIITVLAVGFFLWRTGKAGAMMRGTRSRFERSTRRGQRSQTPRAEVINNRLPEKNTNVKPAAYKNSAYDADDDIYLYGSMEFTTDQPSYIPKSSLTLLEEITAGRFARVYKASYRGRDVAGKVIKDEQSEENRILMMAKINFAATKVGEHHNVLGFVGAVLDNDALGPVLVMEYCQKGQLDRWLSSHRSRVDMKVVEKIQTFALEIARGLDHLAKKRIAHRKLAARNCLLTSDDIVKVAGFGPFRMEENSEEDNAKGDRIPVKWTAPECLESLKEANEKSDIWSYGVTLWEIFSMGQLPYRNVRSRDLPVKIQNGHRLERPEFAEDIHYDLMKSCWHKKPENRPTFTMALDKLEKSFGLRPSSDAVYYYSK